MRCKMSQQSLIHSGVAVLQLPQSVEKIRAVREGKGYKLEFETKAGLFFYARKTNMNKPMIWKSLDSLKGRLIDLGWSGSFIVENR